MNQRFWPLAVSWSLGFVIGLPPRSGFWKWSKWTWNMIHLMPIRNPCRLYIHLAFTYFVGPSSIVQSNLDRPHNFCSHKEKSYVIEWSIRFLPHPLVLMLTFEPWMVTISWACIPILFKHMYVLCAFLHSHSITPHSNIVARLRKVITKCLLTLNNIVVMKKCVCLLTTSRWQEDI